eukprot:gene18661-21852_t
MEGRAGSSPDMFWQERRRPVRVVVSRRRQVAAGHLGGLRRAERASLLRRPDTSRASVTKALQFFCAPPAVAAAMTTTTDWSPVTLVLAQFDLSLWGFLHIGIDSVCLHMTVETYSIALSTWSYHWR